MTPRRYTTPAAFKQAVEHRLREMAAGDGGEHARLRQLLVFDRFLARVVTAFGDRMTLKGGLAVELRLENARTTKDVDLRLVAKPDEVLSQLQKAGGLDLGDFLRFEVQPDPRHPQLEAEGMRYQGFRYRTRTLLAGKIYGSPFGIDVALAEPLIGDVEEVEGSRFLAFAEVTPARFRLYPLETHIAEKLHAYTMPRERPNTRVKDLPDIALLASVRPIAGEGLRAAIERTFEHRGTHPVPAAIPQPSVAWTPVYERMATTDHLRWSTLADLIEAVRAFLDPVLVEGSGRWIPDTWTWE